MPPGTGCSTRPSRACASRSAAKELAIEPTLNLLQDRAPEKRKAAGAGAGEDLQGQRADLCAHHQYACQGQGDFRPLARLSGCRGFAASGQSRRARGGRCAGGFGTRGLSAAVASLLRAEGKLVQKEEARALGSQRAAAVCRHRQHRLARSQEHGADRLSRIFAGDGRHRRAILHRSLDRCAGAAGQGAGRVLASDHAVGASLRADELPGQAARRDDAGARTRPRRASGAGGEERRADGADAADAWRKPPACSARC